jgi:hypothetical protein
MVVICFVALSVCLLSSCRGNGSSSDESCDDGQNDCDGSCVTLDIDPGNCGGCGNRCDFGEQCTAGKCEAADPPPEVITASCTEAFVEDESCPASSGGTTYYVSTSGDDGADGLSENTPVKTLAHAALLPVQPGDRVLFKCGDLWRNEMLTIRASGEECNHIVYGSYPSACEEQPLFSGSYPITGWTLGNDGLWVADLSGGDNAGHFPNGINQVFSGDQRLPLGRWPNLDDPAFPGGYSRIVTHSNGNQISDPNLPSGDWTGAVFHHFSIRWLLLNTYVDSSSSGTLTLADNLDCYDGCGDPDLNNPDDFGWGYFLADHPLTLDEQGEWYYDREAHLLYIVSGAEPADIEGSQVQEGVANPDDPTNDEGFRGLVNLGENLDAPIHHVVVENLRLENGWRDGIGTPINPQNVLSDITIRCNTVRNPDGKGLHLGIWPLEVGEWRGGERIFVLNNVFDGANHNGIRTLANDSVFQDNVISNVGLLENFGSSGLGCAFGSSNCTSNGDGIILERYDATVPLSDNVSVRRNRFSKIGHCGVDILGSNVLVEQNVIDETCSTKGDCGAIASLESSGLAIRSNIVRDVFSPIDGFSSTYSEAFGFGLYIDSCTAECTDNTVKGTEGYGILYQGTAEGDVIGNTVYGNKGRVHVFSGFGGTINDLTSNIMVGTLPIRLMFTEADGRILASDDNYFIQPYTDEYISMQSAEWSMMNLKEWQDFSGQDLNSKSAWFTVAEGEVSVTELFINDTAEDKTFTLDQAYVDLDQQPVTGSLTLAPFTSRVLVAE